MRHAIAPLALALALTFGPAQAQDGPAPAPEEPGLFDRSLDGLFGQFFGKEPAPDAEGPTNDPTGDLAGALRRMGPALRDLATQVDDIRNYQAPERLPNGDILIRRREDAPPPPPLGETLRPDPEAGPDGADPDLTDPDQPQIAL
ncbi:AAA+ family ATPase [Paracoccus gahaiensis]|uniref:AAA+ family ATPase n=1 Tax=Paracoccus gahaiensis TaxID=1706839 RepID=A0A4V5MX91_9RHOB|nr:AAA+ family ATPase [Paracoccus gahaiensis]TJZ94008.1 AAA+ family ATPase [Paracoccus gahaiensis]